MWCVDVWLLKSCVFLCHTQSIWEHPCDIIYREKCDEEKRKKKERKKAEESQELPSELSAVPVMFPTVLTRMQRCVSHWMNRPSLCVRPRKISHTNSLYVCLCVVSDGCVGSRQPVIAGKRRKHPRRRGPVSAIILLTEHAPPQHGPRDAAAATVPSLHVQGVCHILCTLTERVCC